MSRSNQFTKLTKVRSRGPGMIHVIVVAFDVVAVVVATVDVANVVVATVVVVFFIVVVVC